MKNKDLIRTINEVISDFDFLGNDKYLKEEEDIKLLENKDFQKQFICDSLLKKNNFEIDVYDARVGSNYGSDYMNADKLSIEYFLKITYKYDPNKEPIKFDLNFFADDLDVSASGWYDPGHVGGTVDTDREPSGEAGFDKFDWFDIEVSMYTPGGDAIDFLAFKDAPPKIQTLFIREFCEDFIYDETKIPIDTPEMSDNIRNTPYC